MECNDQKTSHVYMVLWFRFWGKGIDLTLFHTKLADDGVSDDVGILISQEPLLILRAVHSIVPGLWEDLWDQRVVDVPPVRRMTVDLLQGQKKLDHFTEVHVTV